LELGPDAFLSKPIDEAELVAQINAMLRIKRAENLLRRERDLLEDVVQERTKALRKSEEKYRSMMEAMNDGVYICSSDFRITYMNPSMIKRIGHDAVGELCHEAINGFGEKCAWCVQEGIEKGAHAEMEVVSPDDGRSYHVSQSPIINADGSISKMTICRDITEHKRAQEALSWEASVNAAIAALSKALISPRSDPLRIFPLWCWRRQSVSQTARSDL